MARKMKFVATVNMGDDAEHISRLLSGGTDRTPEKQHGEQVCA
jgi:hypothetical protein